MGMLDAVDPGREEDDGGDDDDELFIVLLLGGVVGILIFVLVESV